MPMPIPILILIAIAIARTAVPLCCLRGGAEVALLCRKGPQGKSEAGQVLKSKCARQTSGVRTIIMARSNRYECRVEDRVCAEGGGGEGGVNSEDRNLIPAKAANSGIWIKIRTHPCSTRPRIEFTQVQFAVCNGNGRRGADTLCFLSWHTFH